MPSVTPYLVAAGSVDQLIVFLKQAFDAEELARFPDENGSIMHAEVRVQGVKLEMGDATQEWQARPTSLHVYVRDSEAAYRRALEAGGKSLYEPVDQFYGDREAGVIDPAGNHWYIGTRKKGESHIPPGLSGLQAFLHVRDVDGFIGFTERAFGAQNLGVFRAPDGKILYAKTKVEDAVIELGETRAELPPMPGCFHYYVNNCDDAYERALAAGGVSIHAPEDKPYGERTAAVKDTEENQWFLGHPIV